MSSVVPRTVGHLWHLARLVGIALLAGAGAGLIVGGIGSRIAMRIIAFADPSTHGLRTDSGNIVGDITLRGTLDLMLFVGPTTGIFGGLFYLAVRHWIPGSGLWRGLTFGLGILLAIPFVIGLLLLALSLGGAAATAPVLFAALIVYGLAVQLVPPPAERSPPPSSRNATIMGLVLLAVPCLFGLMADVQSIGAILAAAG